MARVLDFTGVVTQGRNLDQARAMLREALREMAEWLARDGEPLPRPDPQAADPDASLHEPIRLAFRVRTGAAP